MLTLNEKNVPRGSGLSKRFIATLIIAVFLLMILFLYFLQHTTPKKKKGKPTENPIQTTEAMNLINALNLENKAILPTKVKSTSAVKLETQLPNAQFLKEASLSSISVYKTSENRMTGAIPISESPSTSMPSVELPQQQVMQNSYQSLNQQNEKAQFLQRASQSSDMRIKSNIEPPYSPCELKAGTLLPATLQTGIHSDLPGTIIAKLRQDVFDTKTGNFLLIPQGTTLIGIYDSQVAYGQERVLIAWQRLIFPNGMSQNLEGQAGVDLLGLAGLEDKVNHHYFRVFGSAVMFSLFGAAAQLSQPQRNSNTLSSEQIVAGAMGQQLSETGAQLVARNMNIQPTIMIRPGANFNVLLAKDLVLPGPYRYEGT